MQIDVWGDLVCPWCYIGKRRLEVAIADFAHRDQVQIRFRSFQLDPTVPVGSSRLQLEVLTERYGIPESRARTLEAETAQTARTAGLEFQVEGRLTGNTFNAHRLIHLARDRGVEAELVDRFYSAQFVEQRSLFDQGSLIELASEVGLEALESVRVLETDAYSDAVRADIQVAARLGVRAVPFTLLGSRYGVSGAQPPENFLGAIKQAWEEVSLEAGSV